MPAHRRREVRLGRPQEADAGTRRSMAGGARHGGGLSRRPGHEVGGARAARCARHRHGRDRHDRYRHRQLYDHRPDRGGDDGPAAAEGRRAPGRFDIPGVRGLRRPVRRQLLDRRRLCRVCEAARGGGEEAWPQCRRRAIRRRRGPFRQPGDRARRRGQGRRAGCRGRDRVRRPCEEVPAVDLRRTFRRGRCRCRDRRGAPAPHASRLRRRPHP